MKKTVKQISVKRAGFALISTIVIASLMLVVALAMLSMSNVSVASKSIDEAQLEARSNARVALMRAIGELQSLTGVDTRITASARLVLDDADVQGDVPNVLGVWRSSEGNDHDKDTGRPYEGANMLAYYNSKNKKGDPNASADEARGEGRFLGFLGSKTPFDEVVGYDTSSYSTVPRDGFVQLVGRGSVSDPKDEIYVDPTFISSEGTSVAASGAIASYVMANNQKAMIAPKQVSDPSATDIVGWQQRVRAGGVAEPGNFGLDQLHDNEGDFPVGSSLPSDLTLQLVNENTLKDYFHDLTSYSVGLQTNSATGGWKRDLSLFMEQYDELDDDGLVTFKPTPETYIRSNKAVGNTNASVNALMYNWSGYRTDNSRGNVWANIPPICSWTALADYVGQYKDLRSNTAASTIMRAEGGNISGRNAAARFQYLDQVRRMPQIARIQWIISYTSRIDPSSNQGDPDYIPGILATPAVVLWNPYNVQLEWEDSFNIWIRQTGVAPLSLTFEQEGEPSQTHSLFEILNQGNDFSQRGVSARNIQLKCHPPTGEGGRFIMPPGSNMIFSLAEEGVVLEGTLENSANIRNQPVINFDLHPGFRPLGGLRIDDFGLETMKRNEEFKVSNVGFYADGSGAGADLAPGIWVDVYMRNPRDGSTINNAIRMLYPSGTVAGPGAGDDIVDELYPVAIDTEGVEVDDVVDNGNSTSRSRPFLSTIFAHRVASTLHEPNLGDENEGRFDHLYTRGMAQANPLTVYSEVGNQDETDDADASLENSADTGVFHPVNAPYDFAFHRVSDWDDNSYIPQAEDETSYIVSGLRPISGLTRCVIAELPTRPVQSLGQLQHFDARNNNLTPPFQFNIIANSSANPIFASDQLYVSTPFNDGYCNDDSYITNHVLFDDWFLSSLSVDVSDFDDTIDRDVTEVYSDFFNLTSPLPNSNYIVSDIARSDAVESNADSTAAEDATTAGRFAYETIASDMIVSGMFNVNNVSVEAWKAILKQGKGNRVPYLEADGSTALTAPSANVDPDNPDADPSAIYPFPRTSIAGDQGVTSDSELSGTSNAVSVSGFTELTDDQIDAIAERIVEQIRGRCRNEGPFLSLSEFVNRKLLPVQESQDLSAPIPALGDKSYALAGTIQRALDVLAREDSDIYSNIKAKGVDIDTLPPGNAAYKFPEAAIGSSMYGLPGWLRQADILTPIAPIISVRDDTFTIRAYGDARNVGGDIIASAWCEAVVQRKGDFVDTNDHATTLLSQISDTNKRYGRSYFIVSFRWMNSDEI